MNSRRKFIGGVLAALLGVLGCISMSMAAEPQDWANLQAYRQKNVELKALGSVKHRVVFLGDSITEFWDQEGRTLFANRAYVNRGISGQTTPQLLLRFRQDVIDLRPEAVVILAGTNDVAGNTGPATTAMITDNIASMTELASAHSIKVVLGAVLPAARYPWAPEIQPVEPIAELNKWLRRHAKTHAYAFIDFYAPMDDGHGGLKAAYSEDGVHPNAAGYEVMNALVKATLASVVHAN